MNEDHIEFSKDDFIYPPRRSRIKRLWNWIFEEEPTPRFLFWAFIFLVIFGSRPIWDDSILKYIYHLIVGLF